MTQVRRGLPRISGGDPWPPAAPAPAASAATPPAAAPPQGEERADAAGTRHESDAAPTQRPEPVRAEGAHRVEGQPSAPTPQVEERVDAVEPLPESDAAPAAVRRGLPRVAGGDPWPPAGAAPAATPAAAVLVTPPPAAPAPESLEGRPAAEQQPAAATAAAAAPTSLPEPLRAEGAHRVEGDAAPPQVEERVDAVGTRHETDGAAIGLRRGLPRVAGGEPWPPAGAAPAAAPAPAAAGLVTPPAAAPAPEALEGRPTEPQVEERVDAIESRHETASAAPEPAAAPAPAPAPAPESAPAPQPAESPAATRVAKPATASAPRPAAQPATKQPAKPVAKQPAKAGADAATPGLRPTTPKQWVAASVLVGLAIVGLATIVVAIVRWFIGLEPIAAFIEQYHGTYDLPEGAPIGFPAWLNWSHFFNLFFIALIVRSGLQVRSERKPPAYFTSRRSGEKVSLTVWLHTSLDVLWVVNGLVFVVLLFATGQWMRIVPTSWEVFPHAISSALQYASLNWPLEDGWVNYNALQQLAYFVTVFIAAPLAIATGVRMSGWWPKSAERLSKTYPIEWARAVHFPTMLYFVAFTIVHVLLVFTTGALRNLNHMFAAKADDDWLGFAFFVGAMLVTAAAIVLARPALLSPIASRFGTVSAR